MIAAMGQHDLITRAPQDGALRPDADVLFGTGMESFAVPLKPIATIAQLADFLINGFWSAIGEIPHRWYSATITYNIIALTAAEQSLASSALNAWHEVTGLIFVPTIGPANITYTHNGTMTASETDSYNKSGIMSSAIVNISQDWIAADGKTGIDSYGYQTYLHETGHALGLGHLGPYNASAGYSSNAVFANDTWQYSVMSYFSQSQFDGGSLRTVMTPQMADIYAAQLMYGSASTRAGDTAYGFNSTAGTIFNFASYARVPALTIYDSGGIDSLDCSGYSDAQTIDLRPGSFSSVGGLFHNIGIAANTTIEIAIGGSGFDTLIANGVGSTLNGGGGNDNLAGGAGNDILLGGFGSDTLVGAAGNDRLVGGAGADTLSGGSGADLFVFAVGDSGGVQAQRDLITDFTIGADFVDLTGFDANPATPLTVDSFRLLGTASFDGAAAALHYFFDAALGVTVVEGDTNGDRISDFSFDLTGQVALRVNDFVSGSVSGGQTSDSSLWSGTNIQAAVLEIFQIMTGSTPDQASFNSAVVAMTNLNANSGAAIAWNGMGASLADSQFAAAFAINFKILNGDAFISAVTKDVFGSSILSDALRMSLNIYSDFYGHSPVASDPTGSVRAKGYFVADMLHQAADIKFGAYEPAAEAFLAGIASGAAHYGQPLLLI